MVMFALPPKADMCGALAHVRSGPIADIAKSEERVSAVTERIRLTCQICSWRPGIPKNPRDAILGGSLSVSFIPDCGPYSRLNKQFTRR